MTDESVVIDSPAPETTETPEALPNTILGVSEAPTAEAETPAAPEPFSLDAVKLPENFALEDTDREFFTGLAADHGLTTDAAQRLIEYGAAKIAAQSQANLEEFNTIVSQWGTETRDAYGGGLTEVTGKIGKVLDQFGTQELRQAFTATGIGNHLELVRFLEKVADAVGEGGPVNPAGQPTPTVDPLARMYPSMKPKE